MTTVMYNSRINDRTIRTSKTRKHFNALPLLMAGLVGLLLWRLGPAAAVGACMIIVGRRVGAGRSTGVTEWLRTAARVRVAAVTFGVALIVAGTLVTMPSAINGPADLRGAVGYLALQCAGLIGAPLFALLSFQSLSRAAKQGRPARPVKNLSYAARHCEPIKVKIAV